MNEQISVVCGSQVFPQLKNSSSKQSKAQACFQFKNFLLSLWWQKVGFFLVFEVLCLHFCVRVSIQKKNRIPSRRRRIRGVARVERCCAPQMNKQNCAKLLLYCKIYEQDQVSSLIHLAWPTVSPVADIVLTSTLFCFEKWRRVCRHKYRRMTCVKTMISTGRECGLAKWIHYY